MSRDIRSFFAVGAKKPAAPAAATSIGSAQKRKPTVLDDSDSENEKKAKPTEKVSKKESSKSKKRRVLDSSDDDEPAKIGKNDTLSSKLSKLSTKSPDGKKKLKPVNVNSAFGDAPVKRVEKEKKKPKQSAEKDLLGNSDDDMDIANIDESLASPSISKTNGKHSSRKEEKVKTEKVSPKKEADVPKIKSPLKVKAEKVSPTKNEKSKNDRSEPDKKKQKVSSHDHDDEEMTDKRKKKQNGTPKAVKRNNEEADMDTSMGDPDQEKFEKRRAAFQLYKQMQKREGPSKPGSKEIPKGKPNCLANLTFVLTGVYESMERDEAGSVIESFGGRVTKAISGKTSYIVVGEDSGPAKLAKAEDLNIPILSEDDLLDLIRERSGMPTRGKDKIPEAKVKEEKPSKHEKKTPSKPASKREIKTEKQESPMKPQPRDEHIEQTEVKVEPLSQKAKEGALAWVDKYKPKSVKDIIGQQTPNSNCAKLVKWLSNWDKNSKKKAQKPNPWAKNDDGSSFKAALLSGPPGVGKTTTAQLVCQQLGFDTIEFNASDTRSKKLLQVEVAELLSNKTLHGWYQHRNDNLTEKQVLLMDEVDGMAGNEDRGGMQELIALIKTTKVPIICMCNDRNHPKIRSLVNYCFDLRFGRPQMGQIKGAVMSILFKEGVKIPPKTVEEIILATNNDVRQTLNSLSLIGAKPVEAESKVRGDNGKKDLKLGPWEVVRKVFSAEEHKTMTLNDKADLFFNDYNIGPLFVQQNYLIVSPNGPKSQTIEKVALTADSLSLGDLVESRIRSKMAWSLLPVQAMYSSVLPGEYMSGHITGQINFPGWLGKYSRTQKRSRMAQEIHDHTRIRTSASRQSIRLDYAPFLLKNILQPMIDDQNDGIEEALSVIKEYHLLREDIDSLVELSTWPNKKSLMDSVDGRVKAALTRAYNKEVSPYVYSATTTIKKKKASDDDYPTEYGEDGASQALSDDEDDVDKDNVDHDALIKKKASSSKASASTSKAKASGSKRAGTSKKK